jgi:hypothetical protein
MHVFSREVFTSPLPSNTRYTIYSSSTSVATSALPLLRLFFFYSLFYSFSCYLIASTSLYFLTFCFYSFLLAPIISPIFSSHPPLNTTSTSLPFNYSYPASSSLSFLHLLLRKSFYSFFILSVIPCCLGPPFRCSDLPSETSGQDRILISGSSPGTC